MWAPKAPTPSASGERPLTYDYRARAAEAEREDAILEAVRDALKAFSNLLIADKPVAVEALRDWIAAE